MSSIPHLTSQAFSALVTSTDFSTELFVGFMVCPVCRIWSIVVRMYISVFALVLHIQYIYWTRDQWDLSHRLLPCSGPSLSALQSQSTFTLFFKHFLATPCSVVAPLHLCTMISDLPVSHGLRPQDSDVPTALAPDPFCPGHFITDIVRNTTLPDPTTLPRFSYFN